MSSVSQIYKRTEVIGRGKFGVVYKGIHRATKQVYAIKVLNLDTSEDEVKDVQLEVQFLSNLKQVPNVTHYYGSYLNGTKLWIIMDYCAGGSLRTLLKPGKIEEKYLGVIVREVLVALQYIHKQNVIHRDIKAANVLITNEGKVQLCDFGVAAQLSSTSLRRNTMAGTPYWMAPEVIMEGTSYDVKADIWSLGITIYEIATGNPPYCDKEAMRAMQLITNSKPPRLEGKQYSPLLKEIIALCLDENPLERLSAEELLKSKFVKVHKNSPTSLLKELISRYLLWREKKSSRESVLMNVEDENDENEIEVKWDFDSLSSNEYILENDINVNNINLNEDQFDFDSNEDYDDGDDEFMTGYQGNRVYNNLMHSSGVGAPSVTGLPNHGNGTINYTNHPTTFKNTYNTNIGSTLKANGTMNRKEAPKSLLQLFEEGNEEEEDDYHYEHSNTNDVDIPRISSAMGLHNLSTTNTSTNNGTRVSTPIVEIEIPNMEEMESRSAQQQQQQQEAKTRSRANTLVHNQSASILETKKTLDPGLQRRPTLSSAATAGGGGLAQAPHITSSQFQQAPNPSPQIPLPMVPVQSTQSLPPNISRGTPSPKPESNNYASPSKLTLVTASPSKTNLSMKAIQSPNNQSPLLQPLNAALNQSVASYQQQQPVSMANSQSVPIQATMSTPINTKQNQVKRNHQNLRLQMPTPTSLGFPKLLHTNSNADDTDENVNQFGVNVSNIPMAMTPLTEKPNPHASATTSTVGAKRDRKLTNGQPPTLPFLVQRANSTMSSQSSMDGNNTTTATSNMTTTDSGHGLPKMDLSLFDDSEFNKDRLHNEMLGLLNGLGNILGAMEEKLLAMEE